MFLNRRLKRNNFCHRQCQAAELRKKTDHLMALVNTGLILEATLINKNIIPYREAYAIALKDNLVCLSQWR